MDSQARREAELEALFSRNAVALADAEQLPPGATLAGALVRLQNLQLDCAGAVRLTALWDRLISWATAQAMIPIGEAVRGAECIPGADRIGAMKLIGEELAAKTHVSSPPP